MPAPYRTALSLLALLALMPVFARALAPTSEGTIPFPYQGETFQTFTKVFGDLSAAAAPAPLVVLHGGPGLSHDYLLPIADLAAATGTPTVFYDQIGNARSTHLRTKPASFWTIDLFVAELANLVAHYGLGGSFALLGHSWGGVLGSEFVVRTQPAGLRKLVLSDTLASEALWSTSVGQLLQPFPEWVQQGVVGGMADPSAFQQALDVFYGVHGCTVRPLPEGIVPGGWTIEDRVGEIAAPTLVINGAADLAQDFVVAPFVQGVPGARWVKFNASSHTPFLEETARYIQVVGGFLAE
ncbi:proline-specific peptidase [Amylostereum chailletii]|nr:proline-specific peptidase [Amylostereum chailletii]